MHLLHACSDVSDIQQAFEWIVKDVQKLKQFIEDSSATSGIPESSEGVTLDDFEVLKESPTLGDGKFKLEIGIFHFILFRELLDTNFVQ